VGKTIPLPPELVEDIEFMFRCGIKARRIARLLSLGPSTVIRKTAHLRGGVTRDGRVRATRKNPPRVMKP
jgi:hypothetical protein